MESKELANKICEFFQTKKGHNLMQIEVTNMTVVTDYFVIVSGKSSTQVKALYQNLEEYLDKEEVYALRKDGISSGKWIAIDYGGVIVHIFLEETREFYKLDRLWSNGENVTVYNDEK